MPRATAKASQPPKSESRTDIEVREPGELVQPHGQRPAELVLFEVNGLQILQREQAREIVQPALDVVRAEVHLDDVPAGVAGDAISRAVGETRCPVRVYDVRQRDVCVCAEVESFGTRQSRTAEAEGVTERKGKPHSIGNLTKEKKANKQKNGRRSAILSCVTALQNESACLTASRHTDHNYLNVLSCMCMDARRREENRDEKARRMRTKTACRYRFRERFRLESASSQETIHRQIKRCD